MSNPKRKDISLFRLRNNSVGIISNSSSVTIRFAGASKIPISEEEADHIKATGLENYTYDTELQGIREKTKAEKSLPEKEA